ASRTRTPGSTRSLARRRVRGGESARTVRERSNRTEQQRRYFFEPLLALAGGSLEGRRVLDAGCGDGFWSLQALDAGADSVLGIDADAAAIEAARRRVDAVGADSGRVSFDLAPVPGVRIDGGYDVALCIGLMERSGKPVELF